MSFLRSKICVLGNGDLNIGTSFFDHAPGGPIIVLACGKGGPRKILTALDGEPGYFLHYT